ncbi:MAG: cupredoxin domain-containing protein [Gemmatimonadota bacterium]
MIRRNVVAVGFLFLTVCGGGSSGDPAVPNNPNSPSNPGDPPALASVALRSTTDDYGYGTTYSFAPASVVIRRGGTVTWSNSSNTVHNVTFSQATGAPANIGDHTGGSNSRTFNTAGSFSYQCTIHNGMAGTVSVQ